MISAHSLSMVSSMLETILATRRVHLPWGQARTMRTKHSGKDLEVSVQCDWAAGIPEPLMTDSVTAAFKVTDDRSAEGTRHRQASTLPLRSDQGTNKGRRKPVLSRTPAVARLTLPNAF